VPALRAQMAAEDDEQTEHLPKMQIGIVGQNEGRMIVAQHIMEIVRHEGLAVHMRTPYCVMMLAAGDDHCPDTCESRDGCRRVGQLAVNLMGLWRENETD
jgi:hypothetical protein